MVYRMGYRTERVDGRMGYRTELVDGRMGNRTELVDGRIGYRTERVDGRYMRMGWTGSGGGSRASLCEGCLLEMTSCGEEFALGKWRIR
jgi:hypothetical protein